MIRNLGDKKPLIDPTAFISEAAYIVGDVVIGKHSSIWPGTVIRADNGKIVIGDSTNIQDNSVVHGDADVFIGDGVTIGHRVMCHAAEVGDGSLIGNGAVVNDGVKIGSRSIIGSGSMIIENMVIPDESIVLGVPGRIKGKVKDRHLKMQIKIAEGYKERGFIYKSQGHLEL